MQWSVLLLILTGHSSVFVCHLYEYHFIDTQKKWDEAQAHCREKHSDLATVHTMTDMKRLSDSTQEHKEAWIGLRCNPGKENRRWHWSLPGVEYNETNTDWAHGEPNDNYGIYLENCVSINSDGWVDRCCDYKFNFICYNEREKSNELIQQNKSWKEAQHYCRQRHTDLASGFHQKNREKFNLKPNVYYWIGLFRDTWRWSDGSNSSFRGRHLEQFQDEANRKCAKLDEHGKLDSDSCDKRIPFICYEDKTILIKQEKTWEEALDYCRENYNDLVSITNLDEQRWVQDKAKNASTPYVWLGLRYTCTLEFWFWVSDEAVNYKNWASAGKKDDCDMSGAMDRGGEHKWFSRPDETTYNFICSKS